MGGGKTDHVNHLFPITDNKGSYKCFIKLCRTTAKVFSNLLMGPTTFKWIEERIIYVGKTNFKIKYSVPKFNGNTIFL